MCSKTSRVIRLHGQKRYAGHGRDLGPFDPSASSRTVHLQDDNNRLRHENGRLTAQVNLIRWALTLPSEYMRIYAPFIEYMCREHY